MALLSNVDAVEKPFFTPWRHPKRHLDWWSVRVKQIGIEETKASQALAFVYIAHCRDAQTFRCYAGVGYFYLDLSVAVHSR